MPTLRSQTGRDDASPHATDPAASAGPVAGTTPLEEGVVQLAFGRPQQQPAVCTSDNLANVQVCECKGSAGRMKHCLCRWAALRERIERGITLIKHISDKDMPVDFLTKWVPAKKLLDSINFLTNAANRVPPPSG